MTVGEWDKAQGVGPYVIGPVRWPKREGPYEVTLHLEWIEGRWECVGVDVRAAELNEDLGTPRPWEAPPLIPPAIVTTSVLRSIPLAKLLEKHFVGMKSSSTGPDMDGTIYTVEHDYTAGPRSHKGGRPPKYDPEHFAEVARIYREALGNRKTPTRAVARHFKTSHTAAAKWVAKARELGLLPKTTRGKARVIQPAKRRRQVKKKGGT
jgi:hypothetical protein